MRYIFNLLINKISRVNLSEQKCVSNKSIISCDDFVYNNNRFIFSKQFFLWESLKYINM